MNELPKAAISPLLPAGRLAGAVKLNFPGLAKQIEDEKRPARNNVVCAMAQRPAGRP